MAAPHRPVTGLDHLPKEVLVHAGLVFAGHLDIARLRQSASEVLKVYPELNVVPKRKFLSPGMWHSPPASQPAWDFKSRDLPDKSLTELFGPAARALELDLDTSSKVTPLGEVSILDTNALFGFEGPPIGSLGWSAIPVLSFRATRLGKEDDGHTLLCMVVPHVITDAVGAAGIIETWGKLYRRETIPARSENLHPDLMKLLDSVPDKGKGNEEIKEDERPGQGIRFGMLNVLSFMKDLRTLVAKGIEERYVHFPRVLLEKYRDAAREQLVGEENGLFVSRLDVFCAMMMKLYAHSIMGAYQDEPLDFYHVYSMSPAFPKGSLPSPYLHNLNAPGWFPFPSSSAVSSAPLSELAIAVRRRLNAFRTVTNVREQILHYDRKANIILSSPRIDTKHNWGMVTSWNEVGDMTRQGFAGEHLVFARPATQNPMDMALPNIAFPWGDGKGGIFTRVTVIKGDWEKMWEKSGLADLR